MVADRCILSNNFKAFLQMKKIFFSIIALSAFASLEAQTLDRSIRPKAGPAPEIKLGEAESFTMPNGLKVFVVENHKLPVVSYSIQLDIRPEPEGDKSGMSGMVAELITSGTKSRDKDKFNEETDAIAAYIGASNSGIFGQSLKKHQEKLLDLMSDALMNADFQQKELDKIKKQTESGLLTQQNEPDAMLNNVTSALVYGKQHPYGEVTTDMTVKNVNLDDCKNYYKRYFRPNVGYMAVVGDINLAEAKAMVEKYFGKWEQAEVPRTEYPPCYAPAANEVDFVARAGSVQSVIGITYPIKLIIGTPDALKARVLNEVLGGSSQGRLFQNLRETHAWTYGAYSNMNADEVVGNFNAYIKCRNEVTDSAITETLKEMAALRNTQVDQATLQNTLNYISGTFALGLENPQTIAQFAINLERYKMPKDYYKNYLKNLNAITAADVQSVAKKFIAPNNAHIVVVGNKSEIPKLKKLDPSGELKYYDNYGNEISSVESKVIDGVSIDNVLAKYISAIGGKQAIESLKDMTVSGTRVETRQGGSMDQSKQEMTVIETRISPDKYKMEMSGEVPTGDVTGANTPVTRNITFQTLTINGDKGFQEFQDDKMELPKDMVEFYRNRGNIQAILTPEKYNISYSLLGTDDVDGKKAYNVEKGEDGGKKKTIQYYEIATGLLIKEIVTTVEQGQQNIEVRMLSDYKEVKNGNGYKIPFTVENFGNRPYKMTINAAKANSGVKEKEFKL